MEHRADTSEAAVLVAIYSADKSLAAAECSHPVKENMAGQASKAIHNIAAIAN